MSQGYSRNLSHLLLPPLCLQGCSLCLSLYSFPENGLISTIFLDSIYALIYDTCFFFSFWLTSLCLTGSRFIHLRRTDSDLFLLAVPLLGIYPEKTIIEKDTGTSVFIAALFTIARTWKQPRFPLTDEWIKKLWYIYNGTVLSHKKEWVCLSSNEVDEPRAFYTGWSESEREKWV